MFGDFLLIDDTLLRGIQTVLTSEHNYAQQVGN